MATSILGQEYYTPFVSAILGAFLTVALFGLGGYGKSATSISRGIDICLSSLGLRSHQTQESQLDEDPENDENLVVDKYVSALL